MKASKLQVALNPRDEVTLKLSPGSCKWTRGNVVRPHGASHSYVEACGKTLYRWTSKHLHTSTPVANRSHLDHIAELTA